MVKKVGGAVPRLVGGSSTTSSKSSSNKSRILQHRVCKFQVNCFLDAIARRGASPGLAAAGPWEWDLVGEGVMRRDGRGSRKMSQNVCAMPVPSAAAAKANRGHAISHRSGREMTAEFPQGSAKGSGAGRGGIEWPSCGGLVLG